ncbi:MAG: HAD-IB family hydrolase, partial [Arenicella sp.]|nr:HAD-IB family hydrolase [Arenicella sp.]
ISGTRYCSGIPRLYDKVIKEVLASPDGPQIAAFFDFDGTIIYGYSAFTYLREQIKRGDVGVREMLKLLRTMADFGLGNMAFSTMMSLTSQFLYGVKEEEYIKLGDRLYEKHISKLIYPESRALIEAHLKKGHTVAIISAATPYQVTAAAHDLGIEHVRCTRLEVRDGKFTGNVIRPTCYAMGKVDAAQQLADKYGADMEQSYFYSDSDEDIHLLEHVGKPRPLNPNSRLRRTARGRGWPVQDFSSRGRVGVRDYVRTFATQASMVTSFLAGLPIYAITGSLNKSRNFSTSLFAETACAIAGVELDVEGEEHVWAHRPCVFVFNHQSQADVLVLPYLLRRDLAGVGKKEIGDIPVLGKLFQYAGTVLIDRQNTASALEAMRPLVDVIQKEGRSVTIAPEGTRSTSTHLGRFKKGAFHLAMQAGVPVVPIVIHNAIDVAPKAEFVLRPATVKVTVLPAVDTSDWRPETINEHVEQVRDMFLIELDQMQLQQADLKLVPTAGSRPKRTTRRSRKKTAAKVSAREVNENIALVKPKSSRKTGTANPNKRRSRKGSA